MNKTQMILAALCFSAVSAQACDTHFWLVGWARNHRQNIADEALFLKNNPKIAARLDKKCENARKHPKRRHHEKPTPTPIPAPTGTPRPTPSPTPTPSVTPTPTPSPTPGCVMGPVCWLMTPDWCATELTLGNHLYDETELRMILNQPANSPNGLVQLARELISAKIGIACNAPAECIRATVAQADFVIGNLIVPPIGNGFLPPASVSNLVVTLHEYNVGLLCAPLCEE
jgi:hypothetical protein